MLFVFLICDLLVPIIMILSGYFMWKHQPNKINYVVGYRTSRSMKNADTWKFAQEYCGKLWFKTGLIMLVPSGIIQSLFYKSSDDIMGIICTVIILIQCIVMMLSIFFTERALKNTFHDDGARK